VGGGTYWTDLGFETLGSEGIPTDKPTDTLYAWLDDLPKKDRYESDLTQTKNVITFTFASEMKIQWPMNRSQLDTYLSAVMGRTNLSSITRGLNQSFNTEHYCCIGNAIPLQPDRETYLQSAATAKPWSSTLVDGY